MRYVYVKTANGERHQEHDQQHAPPTVSPSLENYTSDEEYSDNDT
jgi:hypothetical protein